jgi:hypothetical protein
VATATGCADDNYFEELYQVSKYSSRELTASFIVKFRFEVWISIDEGFFMITAFCQG